MKLVLKEKKKMQEIQYGKFGSVYVKLKPLTFLKLTLPAPDFNYLMNFIDAAAGKQPDEILKIAKNMEASLEPGEVEIGADVVFRGAIFFNKNGPFKPEMAGRLGLAFEDKGGKIQVTSHSGRARSVIAELSGVSEVEASVMAYGFKFEELDDSTQIESQNFGGKPTSIVPKSEIKIED